MHALVSIHDVMPHSLPRVQELLAKMAHLETANITLLVVPGLAWDTAQLATLKQLEQHGYRLAGHGWLHDVRRISTFYHRLHSTCISRRAAEHLSLTPAEIDALIRDCYQWFADQDFVMPDMYVPPAWAMGAIPADTLQTVPFRYFETTSGFLDSETGKRVTLPLAGFEADTLWRQVSLRAWNGVNSLLGTPAKPLRVSVHPNDHHLLLADSLESTLASVSVAVPYASVF
jgi:predicted deacetylase